MKHSELQSVNTTNDLFDDLIIIIRILYHTKTLRHLLRKTFRIPENIG
jgi:hypothetical protein